MHPLPHKSVGFRFRSDLPLLTLRGVGLQRVETHSYCWDNRGRRDEHCLIQFCLEGEGAVVVDDMMGFQDLEHSMCYSRCYHRLSKLDYL